VLSCSIYYTGASPFPIRAAYVINSTRGGPMFEEQLALNNNFTTVPLPIVGPCSGNALQTKGSQVYTSLTFVKGAAAYTATCTITRQYQDAAMPMGPIYWLNFFQGLNSYYTFLVPGHTPNLGLKVEIKRLNATLPNPKYFFALLSVATNQKCMNPGIPDENLPGIVDDYHPANDTIPSSPDVMTHVFETVLPSNTVAYLNIAPLRQNAPSLAALFQGYTLNTTLVILPSPIPPAPIIPPGNEGTVFGVICGVLVIVGAIGIGYYFLVKRKQAANREEYKPLHV